MLVESTSFIINGYLTAMRQDAIRKLTKLKATSKTITVFEGSDQRDPGFTREHSHPWVWFSEANLQTDAVLAAMQREVQTDRHDGVAHYLYADGHVDSIDEPPSRLGAATGSTSSGRGSCSSPSFLAGCRGASRPAVYAKHSTMLQVRHPKKQQVAQF